jgi:hypothetical protein
LEELITWTSTWEHLVNKKVSRVSYLIIVLFVLFLLAVVLSISLRYTACEYSFGSFKLIYHVTNVV